MDLLVDSLNNLNLHSNEMQISHDDVCNLYSIYGIEHCKKLIYQFSYEQNIKFIDTLLQENKLSEVLFYISDICYFYIYINDIIRIIIENNYINMLKNFINDKYLSQFLISEQIFYYIHDFDSHDVYETISILIDNGYKPPQSWLNNIDSVICDWISENF
jgi:hypothetical protein